MTISEQILALQKEVDLETDFIKKLELGDKLIDLKRKHGYIAPPKKGEDCISCSG